MKRNKKSWFSRKLHILLTGLLMVVMLTGMLVPTIDTRAAKDYTYTVRVFAGKQGTIGGETVQEFTDIPYGESFTFNPIQQATVKNDSKYYVKGMRESGKDNNTALANPTFKVIRDMDYVIAYGLKGNVVAYTVRYVDTDGNQLAPPETYYGNVGDKPVVSYLYIDGYFPNANNMTGTLKENAEENVFTFIYQRIQEETTAETTESETETTTSDGGGNNNPTRSNPTTAAPTRANPTTAAPTTTAAGGDTTTTAAATTTAAGSESSSETTTTPPAQPEQPTQPTQPSAEATSEGAVAEENELQNPPTEPTLPASPDEVPDLIDIDDGQVPLAEFSGASTEGETETTSPGSSLSPNDNVKPGNGLSTSKIIVIAAGVILLFVLAGLFLLRRRRFDDDLDDDDEE